MGSVWQQIGVTIRHSVKDTFMTSILSSLSAVQISKLAFHVDDRRPDVGRRKCS